MIYPRISDNTLDGLRVRDIRGITAGLAEFMGIDRGVGGHGWAERQLASRLVDRESTSRYVRADPA